MNTPMRKVISRCARASVSTVAVTVSLFYAGVAHAAPAVYFNEDADEGMQAFKDTVADADDAYNTDNPGSPRSSVIYEYDILSTSGDEFMVIGPDAGDPSVIVKTIRGGAPAPNNGTGDEGGDGFTNWSNSYSGGFSDAEDMGYTYQFYETDGTTPFQMNAIGTMVNDWGTCCTSGNAKPDGGTANASEVYLRFGNSSPLLLGGISSAIPGVEHFIGAINDTNFFNEVTIIANGNGEYFGAGGYLLFSSVALNSVPEGSSTVDDTLGGGSTPIPDIDTAASYYTGGNLADGEVNPNFVGGTLMFDMNTSVNTSFTVQSQGGAIDTEENIVVIHGGFSGVGTMRKTGSGLLVLSGNNSQQGGFTVSQGTLQASSDANLGGGPLRIGNATFQAAGNITSNREMVLQHANSTFDTQDNNILWEGDVTGNGALNLSGNGRLVLTGNNSYSGGTLVEAGTLAGTTSSLQGDIVNNGIVEFNQSDSGTYAGEMMGSGALNFLGNGRLVLTGGNSYSGGTLVDAGTLAGTTASIQGDIVNNGLVEFNQSAFGAYNGIMSGTGGLRKLGGGQLTLNGINSLAGSSYVDEGTLAINGLLGFDLMTVADGATLQGSGVGNGNVLVLSGGRLSPGNSPGTMYVSGDVTLNEGAIFVTEIDGNIYSAAGGAGTYDRLVLTGEGATFTAGGSINPILRGISGSANNTFTPGIGDVFTVVTADNIEGAFDALSQPQDGLAANTRFKLIYNQDSIQLALVADSLGLLVQEQAAGRNPVAAGYAIDMATANGQNATGRLADLLDAFTGMDESEVAVAMKSLSGDMHAHIIESTETILSGSDDMVLTAARGGSSSGLVSDELDNGVRVWSRAEARGASYDPDGRTMGFDEDVYGLTLGATLLNRDDMKAGIAGSYKTVDLYTDAADGATNHMLSLYAYGSRNITPRLTLSGLAGYTRASAKVSRTTPLGAATGHSRSKEDISVLHAQVEGRYEVMQRGATSVYAIGGLRTANANIDAYQERGSLAYTQLSLSGESRNTLQTKLGAEVTHNVAKTDLSLFANWTRDIGADPKVEREVRLGDAIWRTTSVDRDLDTYNYGARAYRDVTERVGMEIEYTGRYNSSYYDAQQIMFGVNVAW